MGEARGLSSTDYNVTISTNTRLTVIHPFLSYYGKEFILVNQYMQCGSLYLQCIDESEHRMITLPASFTDFSTIYEPDRHPRGKESYYNNNKMRDFRASAVH